VHAISTDAHDVVFDSSVLKHQESAAVDVVSCIALATTTRRKGFVSPEQLSKQWHIGLESARRTVEKTTQRAVRDFIHTTGGRRLKPYAFSLRYPRKDVPMFTDTVFGKVKSLSGNTCAQVYGTSHIPLVHGHTYGDQGRCPLLSR